MADRTDGRQPRAFPSSCSLELSRATQRSHGTRKLRCSSARSPTERGRKRRSTSPNESMQRSASRVRAHAGPARRGRVHVARREPSAVDRAAHRGAPSGKLRASMAATVHAHAPHSGKTGCIDSRCWHASIRCRSGRSTAPARDERDGRDAHERAKLRDQVRLIVVARCDCHLAPVA